MSRHILILGATSGIARGVANALAARGDHLHLAARNVEEAERVGADLTARHGSPVSVLFFDATDLANHADFVGRIDRLDGVVLAFGFMADQKSCESDVELMRKTVELNYLAAMAVLEPIAQRFEEAGSGFIAALSSVAGDRGRQSNYIYGSAKAGLTAYLSGLRNRLARKGIRVLTIKPGIVYTAMTAELFDKESPLVAMPRDVGEDVAKAIDKNRTTIYTPWFWRWIMFVICSIPERVFQRMKL